MTEIGNSRFRLAVGRGSRPPPGSLREPTSPFLGEVKRVWLTLVVGNLPETEHDYAVAPFAFGRRKCSASRGMISTKLQGR